MICVGNDNLLLETRRLLLKEHFHVEAAGSVEALAALLDQQHFPQAVVLCHSLSCDERLDAVETTRARSPETKILQILSSRDDAPVNQAIEAVSGLDGPAALLRTLAGMLRLSPEQRSAAGLPEGRG